jgi:hypothetical protein
MVILVADPYRSCTNDHRALMTKNVDAMTDASLTVFRAGYLPVVGEWFALPLIEHAGSKTIGDPIFNEIFHPISRRCVRRRRRDGGPHAQPRQARVLFARRGTARLSGAGARNID